MISAHKNKNRRQNKVMLANEMLVFREGPHHHIRHSPPRWLLKPTSA